MPKIIHQRTGAPFALVKDQALPANISTSYGDVSTEIAVVNGFTTAVSGTNTIVPVEPTTAKQVLRWHFLTTQSAVGPSSYFTDFGPDGKRGIATSLNDVNASWAAMAYGTHNGSTSGAYGALFYGGDVETRRVISDPLDKLTGTDTIRVAMVVQPRTWTDRPEGMLFELLSGTGGQSGSSSITTCRRQPDGSLIVRGVAVKNVFVDDAPVLVEIQYRGIRTDVFVNGEFRETIVVTAALNTAVVPRINIGNATSGGRAFTGYISYAAVYVGELTEAEIAWARNEAKTVVAARPSGLQILGTMPAPKPDAALKFSALPNTSPSSLQMVGGMVSLIPGRAVHGITGPIATTHKVMFGPTAGTGTDITPPDLTVITPGEGYLTYEMTADNGVHPPVTVQKVLPVAVSYPTLGASTIATRLTCQLDQLYVDASDAGFPADTVWKSECVCDPGDGTVGLRIIKNAGSGRANTGGSVQIRFQPPSGGTAGWAANIYRADYTMQLIDTRGAGQAKGYIQTAFTYTDPYTLPRREYDFEFNSKTGRMECTIHLEPNNGGGSVAQGIHVTPPEEAFTSMRKWSILANADRVEWFYEDQLLTRYIRGSGWDASVQTFTPYTNLGVRFNTGDTYVHPQDAGWHVNPQNMIIQQWMSDNYAGWIGPNTVPISHPLLRFSDVSGTMFGRQNTLLQVGDWTAVAGGAGQVVVNVSQFRPLNTGFRPTHLEYSVDDGTWTRFAGTTGNQTITGLAAGSRSIRVRPVAESLATNPAVTASNYTMNADPSDTKVVTVT